MSDSLQPHGQQHTGLCCPSPASGACSNSCPSSRWCHPIISSSVIPFYSCLQSFPASEYFPMSQFFPSGSQSNGVSASASVLPTNIQGLCPFGFTALTPCSPRDSQESALKPKFKSINSSAVSFLYSPILTSIMTTGKNIALTIQTFVGKIMSLLFNMLSRFVIAFLHMSFNFMAAGANVF